MVHLSPDAVAVVGVDEAQCVERAALGVGTAAGAISRQVRRHQGLALQRQNLHNVNFVEGQVAGTVGALIETPPLPELAPQMHRHPCTAPASGYQLRWKSAPGPGGRCG